MDKKSGKAPTATPHPPYHHHGSKVHQEPEISGPDYYFRLLICALLVLSGGLLAGLTLGLMSLDETNLHILATSGTPTQREYAKRIQPIRKNGHWLLVTLLLGNTVINETLPIVMDSIFGGGVTAVLVSTASIVIFGEIIPQAACARYGLAIGAFFAWPVRILQIIISPLGYPIACLLDWVLGADHGITYKKAELKELVSLSDTDHGGSLSKDEVTIIRGALDLSEKLVVDVMTDIKNVYMIDANWRLDRKLMSEIVKRGHSRVPIYEDSRDNIIGVLLVKSLILLDPDDCVPVREVKMLPIPSVTPDISLYDILNTFQEGGSHMAIVIDKLSGSLNPNSGSAAVGGAGGSSILSDEHQRLLASQSPSAATRSRSRRRIKYFNRIAELNKQGPIEYTTGGTKPNGGVPLGVITLEDVIEELIQEEIIDETDVFVDVRNRIKVVRAVSHARPADTIIKTGAGGDQMYISDESSQQRQDDRKRGQPNQVPSQPLSMTSQLLSNLLAPSTEVPHAVIQQQQQQQQQQQHLRGDSLESRPGGIPRANTASTSLATTAYATPGGSRRRENSLDIGDLSIHDGENTPLLRGVSRDNYNDYIMTTVAPRRSSVAASHSRGNSTQRRRVRRGVAFSARRRALPSDPNTSSSDEHTQISQSYPDDHGSDHPYRLSKSNGKTSDGDGDDFRDQNGLHTIDDRDEYNDEEGDDTVEYHSDSEATRPCSRGERGYKNQR
ncbi:hypothetical protein H4219_003774 [Mycoemilia scoparia]|uniref:CNNM transmembrane domain-containing protein n=1 Tax=Mycoemilia scoparia TaxID=417184 RepID=A0A9W8DSW6_9FUNG|nr:hypothetical protein H4219_003774 [Mycoemilia scoparia]